MAKFNCSEECCFQFQGVGDTRLAGQCLRLAISADSTHAPAYNNLGVLELRRGRVNEARAFFQAAASLAPYLFEPYFNHAALSHKVCSRLVNRFKIDVIED